MAEPTAEDVAQRSFDLELLDDRQLQDVWATLGSRDVRASEFLQVCVRREFMTNYQVERLLTGERTGFFFSDYKILYLVGTGTFSRVYRAVHRKTGKVAAVKVLRKRYSDSSRQSGQFVREGELGCTLRHPNIVPIYEVYSEGNLHLLAMEFVEGRNLREFIKIRKKVDADQSTRLIMDVTAGLDYAFDRGLHHRDMKMSNVLISSQGRAKLVDFGLAAINEDISDEALMRLDIPNTRTIDYAALERATGVRRDDARSDIYFLGCMYYHMLVGKPPLLETKDRTLRLSRSRFEDIIPIQQADPSLPNSVTVVVGRAMAIDPDHRYQTPAQMLSDLKLAVQRLDGKIEDEDVPPEGEQIVTEPVASEEQRSLMVVESNTQVQDVLRKGLKKAGYRVLVTGDPDRAVDRFLDDVGTADCIVFSAQEIGQTALTAFNRLAESEKTQSVPALLLLDENQRAWKQTANTAEHRIVLLMPLKMKRLRKALAKLVPSRNDPNQDAAEQVNA